MDGTDYPANAVVCKLWGLVGSPVEFILALSVYKALSHSYESWTCWIYSDEEYRQQVADGGPHQIGLFALVPQLRVDQVGEVDGDICSRTFQGSPQVAEADGHLFHERTVEQASKDRRRDRILQRCRIPVFRFTRTDLVRGSEESAYEIVDYIDERARLSSWRRMH